MSLTSIVIEKCGNFSLMIETNELSVKILLPTDRFLESDVRGVSRKSLVIRFLKKPTIQPRRCHFKHVLVWDQIFHIENQTYALAHCGAVIGTDSIKLIDVDAQSLGPSASHLRVNQFDAGAGGYSLNDFFDARIKLHFSSNPLATLRASPGYEKGGRGAHLSE